MPGKELSLGLESAATRRSGAGERLAAPRSRRCGCPCFPRCWRSLVPFALSEAVGVIYSLHVHVPRLARAPAPGQGWRAGGSPSGSTHRPGQHRVGLCGAACLGSLSWEGVRTPRAPWEGGVGRWGGGERPLGAGTRSAGACGELLRWWK